MAKVKPTSLVQSISGSLHKDDSTYFRVTPSGKTVTCAKPEKTPVTMGSRRMQLMNNFSAVTGTIDSFLNTPSDKLDLFRADFNLQRHSSQTSKKRYVIFRNYCIARLMAESSNTPFPPSARRTYPRTPRTQQ